MLIVDQLRKDDRRLSALAGIVLGGMAVLLGGLWLVQVVSAKRFQTTLDNQTLRTVRLPAIRGKILDRNGLVLAENRPSYNLDLYIEELRPYFDREFTRARAGRKLSRAARAELREQTRYAVASNAFQQVSHLVQQPLQLTDRQFHRHHEQWPYRPLPVLENLSAPQIARFLEQAPGLPGLDLEVQPLRAYPNGSAVAHVIGYLSRDDLARDEDEGGFNYSLPSYQGAVGLEYAFEKELSGKPGIKSVMVNSLSYRESETVWATSEPGQTVVLALDLPIQRAAAEALRSAGPGVRGAAVVLDALNGDILALASAPAYDPNEFVTPISSERWGQLNDPKFRPMFNRATHGAYPPGSTFKMVTALACLEVGELTPSTLTNLLNNPGYYQLGRRRIRDLAEPGDYDFRRAFKRSSNTYFIHHGLRAGRDRILELGRRFHLGERVGLPTRQEVSGDFPRPEEVRGIWNDGNTANLCIGQEITVTPLQMAVLTAAIANGGKVWWPRLVARLEPAEAGLEETRTNYFPPRLRSELNVAPRHLEILRAAMFAEVEDADGTGHPARVGPGFGVCGKTGTAQIMKGTTVVDHITWFASFGPYENPRYVVVVMVESGGSGGGACAPLARQVYQAIQKRLRGAPPAQVKLAQAG